MKLDRLANITLKTEEDLSEEFAQEIIDSVLNQTVYWSDDSFRHWFFDYKIKNHWISTRQINNELTKCTVTVVKA